jgi:hypothetical protein
MVDGLLFAAYGQSTPAAGWQINNITLPYGPQKFGITGAPNESEITQSGEEPIIIIDGLSGTTLALSGTIDDDTKNDDQLWTDIIQPLLDLRGAEITLVCPVSALNGTWVLVDFQPSRSQFLKIYDYTLRLKKSCLTVTLDASIDLPR